MSDPNHPTAPRRLLALQRRRQAFQMKLAGMYETEIAAALGVTQPRVSQMINDERREIEAATAEDKATYRKIQTNHIFQGLAVALQGMQSKDAGERYAATDRMERLHRRLAALYGLDEPERKDITSDGKAIGTEDTDARREILRKLDSIAAATGAAGMAGQPNPTTGGDSSA